MIKKFIQLIRKDIHDLEYEAKTQYKYHRTASIFWLGTMVLIPFIPYLYGGDIGILIILEVSLYANFGTEFGAMSAAEAAVGMPRYETTIAQATPGTVTPIVEVPDSKTDDF